jgi:hypothetical protein
VPWSSPAGNFPKKPRHNNGISDKPAEDLEGQVSTITKASLKIETSFDLQIQELSITENNFLFLTRQKKRFITK